MELPLVAMLNKLIHIILLLDNSSESIHHSLDFKIYVVTDYK